MREGYYAVINGYKTPYLDRDASKNANDDRYLAGTTFDDIYSLFEFDRSLRFLTFHNLIRAEATSKTAIAYTFADAHRDNDAYLLQDSYCSESEFKSYLPKGKSFADEVSGLIAIMKRTRDKSDSEFISHYRDRYGSVPIWVLCNALTFGNVQHFFNLMKPADKIAVCKMITHSTGRTGNKTLGYFDVDEAKISLEALVKFRNICAHDERLYCASVGGRKSIGYGKMVWMLERFLTEDEFKAFLSSLAKLVSDYASHSKSGMHLLESLGFNELSDHIEKRLSIS